MSALESNIVTNGGSRSSYPRLRFTQVVRSYASYDNVAGQIFIPSIQRSIVQAQVDQIKQHILGRIERGMEPILGIMDLVNFNAELFVIDGMHRLTALEQLYRERNISIPFSCIIYDVTSNVEMEEIFIARNRGVPVPEFITSSHAKRLLLEQIQTWIQSIPGFKETTKNRPYINIRDFMSALGRSRLLGLVDTIRDFYTIFNNINEENRHTYTTDPVARDRDRVTLNMLEKCHGWGNYIGLDRNCVWFDHDYDISPFARLLGRDVDASAGSESENLSSNITFHPDA